MPSRANFSHTILIMMLIAANLVVLAVVVARHHGAADAAFKHARGTAAKAIAPGTAQAHATPTADAPTAAPPPRNTTSTTPSASSTAARPSAAAAALHAVALTARQAMPAAATLPRVAAAETATASRAGRPGRLSKLQVKGTIKGALKPGISLPVTIKIKNPSKYPVRLYRLKLKIIKIRAPRATKTRRCTTADFAIVQLPGRYGPRIPARRSRNLTQLRIARKRWPRLVMRNLPVNQDGCKLARLTIRYTGTARRSH
jgi:hypothetical protein